MANAQRRKGLRGEAEVAAIWRANGFDPRGLEGKGDHSVVPGLALANDPHYRHPDLRIHCEVKRENRLRAAWTVQAEEEAPALAFPLVVWRPDRRPWWAMSPFEDLAGLLA